MFESVAGSGVQEEFGPAFAVYRLTADAIDRPKRQFYWSTHSRDDAQRGWFLPLRETIVARGLCRRFADAMTTKYSLTMSRNGISRSSHVSYTVFLTKCGNQDGKSLPTLIVTTEKVSKRRRGGVEVGYRTLQDADT
eukprot:217333-Hanusia_phi.AAC.2